MSSQRVRGTGPDPGLAELMKKPTLTYGEQLFVLQAMNDGVQF